MLDLLIMKKQVDELSNLNTVHCERGITSLRLDKMSLGSSYSSSIRSSGVLTSSSLSELSVKPPNEIFCKRLVSFYIGKETFDD